LSREVGFGRDKWYSCMEIQAPGERPGGEGRGGEVEEEEEEEGDGGVGGGGCVPQSREPEREGATAKLPERSGGGEVGCRTSVAIEPDFIVFSGP
jgi:hypothetical protein